jgi:hypothetical protein
MPTPGQVSLNNFYQSVRFSDPLLACLMSEDIVSVALNSLALDHTSGQDAANRLRAKACDLPILMCIVLDNALTDLGYS